MITSFSTEVQHRQGYRAAGIAAVCLLMVGNSSALAQSRQNITGREQQRSSAPSEKQTAEASTKSEEQKKEAEPKKVMIGGVEWYVDYDAALKVAQERNKPIWLHFGENPG